MLNLQTENENPVLPDQSENAVWLYAGIASAILIGAIIIFIVARIVARSFRKNAASQAKSHRS